MTSSDEDIDAQRCHPLVNALYYAGKLLLPLTLSSLIFVPFPSRAQQPLPPALWLCPMDDVTKDGTDIHQLLASREHWKEAARRIQVISLSANYLVKTPKGLVKAELQQLSSGGIRLNVVLGVLPADKRVCGNKIEGISWPNEAGNYARRLRDLGADIDSFGFDLPLTDGHFLKTTDRRNACSFSIVDTAKRLAGAIRQLRAYYPNAKLFDEEVPTGIPTKLWLTALDEWLRAFRAAAGRPFDGLIMDAWWKSPWQETVRQTAGLLRAHDVGAGIFIDESAGANLPAEDWITATKRNLCTLRRSNIPLDFFVIANWTNTTVKNIPEDDRTTLTGLVDWVSRPSRCPQESP